MILESCEIGANRSNQFLKIPFEVISQAGDFFRDRYYRYEPSELCFACDRCGVRRLGQVAKSRAQGRNWGLLDGMDFITWVK